MTQIISQVSNYLNGLDWTYIFTLIIISHGFNHHRCKGFLYKVFKVKVATRYRVLAIGLAYGVAIYFMRGQEMETVERLLQSFAFALVFHKLLLEEFIRQLTNWMKTREQ